MTAGRLAHLASQGTERRTALPAAEYERTLPCTGCGVIVGVFEAATGARTRAEHEHIDPASFRCADCLGAS